MEQQQHFTTPLGVRIVRSVASDSREMASQAELDDDNQVDREGAGLGEGVVGGGRNGAGDRDWGRKGDGDWDEDTHRSRAVGTDPHITRYYDIAGAEEHWHWCLRQRLWRAQLWPPTSPSVWHQQRPLPECSAMRTYTSATNGYSSQQLKQHQLLSLGKSPLLANGSAAKNRSLYTENASQHVGEIANSGECNRQKSRSLLMRSSSTSRSSRGLQIDDPILEEDSCCCFERQCSSSAFSNGCGADGADITCCKHKEERQRPAALTLCDEESDWNVLHSDSDCFGEELSNARLQQSLPRSHDSHAYEYEASEYRQPNGDGDWERSSSPLRNGHWSGPSSDARQSLARSQSPTRNPPARSQSQSPSRHVSSQVRSPSAAGHFGCEPFGAEAEGSEGEWGERVDRCGPRGTAGENDRFERYLTQARRELELFGDTVEFYKQWNAISASDIPSRLTFPH